MLLSEKVVGERPQLQQRPAVPTPPETGRIESFTTDNRHTLVRLWQKDMPRLHNVQCLARVAGRLSTAQGV
eukprot:scaffold667070_cov39-Prasinocladus_malaysianus.AAC.1